MSNSCFWSQFFIWGLNRNHPVSPSRHERQGERDSDTLLQPVAPCEKPKRGLFSLSAWWSKRKASASDKTPSAADKTLDHDDEISTTPGLKEFLYEELVRATGNFSVANKLGVWGSGDVYGGQLASGMLVSVNRLKEFGGSSSEYFAVVKSLSHLAHGNLVKLIGWCHEAGKCLLVFEYTSNGTLYEHLFGDIGGSTFPWKARYRVALGLASALCYLHRDWKECCVLHKNINSHSVLLDEGFNTKLGISTTVAVDAAGTEAYIAPELCASGEYTTASDVYSFGVVALEIACGRSSSQYPSSLGCGYLMQWVRRCHEYEILFEASDEKLRGDFDCLEMELLMLVGLWCTHCDPAQRPQMEMVLRVLQFQEAPPFPLYPVCAYPDHYRHLDSDLAAPRDLSRTPSISSACDSDLDDCLR